MNFLHILRRFVFIFLAFICCNSLGIDLLASHYQETGLPTIQTCTPGLYIDAKHFNSLVQGNNGFIYVAALNGILRYDSRTWKHISIEGNIQLTSHLENIIAWSNNQLFKIPSTPISEFEYPDSLIPSGEYKLTGNILQVLSLNENLYILTSTGLFLQNADSFSKINTDTRVIRIFPSKEGAVLLTEGNQYYTHHTEQVNILDLPWELDSLSDLVPYSDKALYVNGPFSKLIIEKQGKSPFKLEQPASFLDEFGYQTAAWMKNGELAIGTKRGGLFFATPDGEVTGRISMVDGLYSNKVIQILGDSANNLWILHEHAISRIEIPSPVSHFRDVKGLEGNTQSIVRHEGVIYAAGSHGLFRLQAASEPLRPSSPGAIFKKIEELPTGFVCLESVPEGILAGGSEGLFLVTLENEIPVFPDPVNCMKYLSDQNILFVGTDEGIRIYNLKDWSEIRNFSLPKINIDNIEISPDNFLWLSSRSGRLYRSNKPMDNPGNLECKSYRAEQLNAPRGSFTRLIRTSDRLWFSTLNGLFGFDPVTGSFYPDTVLNLSFDPGSYRVSAIKEDRDKNLWMDIEHSENRDWKIWYADSASGESLEFKPLQYRGLENRMVNCLYPGKEGILWIGTDKGILRYNSPVPGHPPSETFSFTYISGVFSGMPGDTKMKPLKWTSTEKKTGRIKVPFGNKRLKFEFLTTSYNSGSMPSYRYSLEGLYEDWSEWTKNDFAEFNRLKTGRYSFHVQSRDIYGSVSESDTFHFRIKSHILISWYALIFYSLLILVFLYYLQKWLNLQKIRGQFHLEEVVQERTESLIKEKDKAEDLLANILPKTTADELKAGGKATSSKFKMCTVLFADIQGFTKIAEEMNPDKLIDQLDKFYYQFDSVVEKYNIEKIKTIGDAYMAAGGIPIKNRTNPVDVVLAALEMQQYMQGLKETKSDIWDLRIGIHTGSVIAGVVGQKKFSYDIWGDSVNTASRMESSGEVGKVNISATTYKLIKDFFQCEFRGKMPVKYKGDIAMFFVNGLNPTFSESDKITPNAKFNVQIQLLRLLDLEEVILEKLQKELPENLFFHNVEHTSHVYSQVELLGRGEQVSDEDLLLLQTAALLHDVGYIQGMEDHEEHSVEFAREILPLYRYNEEQIEQVCKLILATGLPPKPESLLEQIICDANLDHLGRVDFLIQSDKLFQEYRIKNKIRSKKDWNKYQIDFLKSHEFYTSIAKRMREVPKALQIENIKQYS